jgi:hypothetical protein
MPPPEEWKVQYSVPPVYCRLEDEGWARLSATLAKSAAEAGIITVDDDEDNGGEDGGDALDWSAFDYYGGRS